MFKKLGKKIINHYEKQASCSCNSDSAPIEPCCGPEIKSKDDCCEKADKTKKCC